MARFSPYLEDLRKRLFFLAIMFVVVFFFGLIFSGPMIRALLHVFAVRGVIFAATSPFQIAGLAVDIGLLCAFLVCIPFATYSLLSFAFPAIAPRARRAVLVSVPLSAALFIAGAGYGFAVLYYSLQMLAGFNDTIGLSNIWDIGSLIASVLTTAMLLGILFQFPLVLGALIRLNIMNAKDLASYRRLFYFATCIVVALLPPTDGLSMCIMALPLLLLYEMVLLVHRIHYYHNDQ